MRIPPIDPSQQYAVAIAKIWNNYLGLSCLLLFLGGNAMIKYKIGGTLFSHKPSMAQWLQRRFYPVWPEVVSLTSGVVLGAFPGNSKHGTWVGETWDVIGHVSPKCPCFPPNGQKYQLPALGQAREKGRKAAHQPPTTALHLLGRCGSISRDQSCPPMSRLVAGKHQKSGVNDNSKRPVLIGLVRLFAVVD